MRRVATVILRDGMSLVWEDAESLGADAGVLTVQYRAEGLEAARVVLIPLDLVKSAALDPMPT